MKSINRNVIFLLLAVTTIFTSSCTKEIFPDDYGVFSPIDANTAEINGVIETNTPEHWENFIAAYPKTTSLIMKDCPGSEDDEANLEAARRIRQQGVTIHLPADAVIASGAVDLFLAGTTRTREAGSKIGVHAWANGKGDEATDYPEGHIEHQSYIEYYREMGFSEADAKAFYYFTINAAEAADIHWMTDSEIKQFKLLTQ